MKENDDLSIVPKLDDNILSDFLSLDVNLQTMNSKKFPFMTIYLRTFRNDVRQIKKFPKNAICLTILVQYISHKDLRQKDKVFIDAYKACIEAEMLDHDSIKSKYKTDVDYYVGLYKSYVNVVNCFKKIS